MRHNFPRNFHGQLRGARQVVPGRLPGRAACRASWPG